MCSFDKLKKVQKQLPNLMKGRKELRKENGKEPLKAVVYRKGICYIGNLSLDFGFSLIFKSLKAQLRQRCTPVVDGTLSISYQDYSKAKSFRRIINGL